MSLFPQQSFEHTLREISVNRNDPCEVVRELISNSYDAGARNIFVIPLYQKRGLIYFDDGCGLSALPGDGVKGVLPYVAFFSIGKGTKIQGQQIGYKCQGSKLCFASSRFSLITKCPGERGWRHLSIQNPKTVLNEQYDISPATTGEPWGLLADNILAMGDNRTAEVIGVLTEEFFRTKFKSGLMVVIEEFEVDSFDDYFSVSTSEPSYLREYIRFHTAHADVRRIGNKSFGFRPSDVNQLRKHVKPAEPSSLYLWTSKKSGGSEFVELPGGWPYLPVPAKGSPESPAQSPEEVPRLRDGTFFARYADSFKYEGQFFNLVLAIDGKRRALNMYEELGRQRVSRSGVRFTDQRGVILCSQGVRVCPYPAILDHPSMNGWGDLAKGAEHYVFFIEGPFELVTNRNLPAQSAITLLKDAKFVKQVSAFLTRSSTESGGVTLKELLNRISREASAEKENEYVLKNQTLKDGLRDRLQFRAEVPGAPALSEKWFVAPTSGEEHFVGALYTLFSASVPNASPNRLHWHRPLTFKSLGIDAIAVSDEDNYLGKNQLQCVEYKYVFSASEQFNHPLTITDRIVCWSLDGPKTGETIEDSFGYQATVGSTIDVGGKPVGFELEDVRHKDGGKERHHKITVYSLYSLLDASFKVHIRQPPQAKTGGKRK